MFDKKIEPVAMKFVRAKLMVEEANELLELAKTDLSRVLPEGGKYVTKDGDTVTHVKASVRKSWLVEVAKKRFTPRIWKAVRIDAIDTKKLNGFIDAGELDVTKFADCFEEIPVKSSMRVTFAGVKPTTINSKQVA
jgi:hypothetical protein